jgi:hypothetical protein
MAEWGSRVEVPELGPGWARMTKPRSSGTTRLADHVWIAPSGKKFRSEKQAAMHAADLASGASVLPTAAAAEAAGPAKKKAKAAKPVARSAKVPYNPPASRQLAAAPPVLPEIVCCVCKGGDEPDGNAILLCDGPGCSGAYHMACLPEPLARVPEGDWLCPSCERPPPPVALALKSPHGHSRQQLQLNHVVDGSDLGEWAAAEARQQAQQRAAGPFPALRLQDLPGRACLVTLPPKHSGNVSFPPKQSGHGPAAPPPAAAAPKPGLVIDARWTEVGGELCVCVWLGGRSQPTWLSTAPSSAACVHVGAELCCCKREPHGVAWPARAFRPLTKALLTPGGEAPAAPGGRRAPGKARGRGRGASNGRGLEQERASAVWLKFFDAPGAPLLHTTSDLLSPLPLATEEPLTEAGPALQVCASSPTQSRRVGPPLTPP